MTIKQALQGYVDKKLTAIELIGDMTGMIKPEQAVDILALINQITRLERGTMDEATFKAMYELE
jgi:hypothetical protein